MDGRVVVLNVCWPAWSPTANYSSMLRIPLNKHQTVESKGTSVFSGRCRKQAHHLRTVWPADDCSLSEQYVEQAILEKPSVSLPPSMHLPFPHAVPWRSWLCRCQRQGMQFHWPSLHTSSTVYCCYPTGGKLMMPVITYNFIIIRQCTSVI